MAGEKPVAVIIPFYKDTLSAYEAIALEQCFKVLSSHPIIAIKPESLVLSAETTKYPFFDVVSFDNDYFKNVQGYNRLMLDSIFYERFLAYEHILIHQLDAFVFRDDLLYWCEQPIDYVGAPWIKAHPYPDVFKAAKSIFQHYFHTFYNIQKDGLPSDKQFEYKVGNGGFSLRRTQRFYDLCLSHKKQIAHYNQLDNHKFNEDIFWSIEVNRRRVNLNIPKYKEALQFSFEFYPKHALFINNTELPFGCHAWHLHLEFWMPIFELYGYEI